MEREPTHLDCFATHYVSSPQTENKVNPKYLAKGAILTIIAAPLIAIALLLFALHDLAVIMNK